MGDARAQRSDAEDLRIAIHEAGHAVAAFAAALPPVLATIEAGDGMDGGVLRVDRALEPLLERVASSSTCRRAVLDRVRVSLGGRAAEAVVLGVPVPSVVDRLLERGERPDDDLVRAGMLVNALKPDDASAALKLLVAADAWVRRWLYRERVYVQELARRLLLERTVVFTPNDGEAIPRWRRKARPHELALPFFV